MNTELKEKIFETEINYIKNTKYQDSLRYLLTKVPDYFYRIPASTTGKYHPRFALGDQGLIRHTKVAVTMAYELLQLEMYNNNFTKEEQDLMLMALMLHDTLKCGRQEERYTRFDHPLLVGEFLKEEQAKTTLSDEEIEFLSKVIASHMGQWNTNSYSDVVLPKPKTKYEKFVHMCDYLASRKFINVDFKENEIER